MKFRQKILAKEKIQVLLSYGQKSSNVLVYTSRTYQMSKLTRVEYVAQDESI